jgi:intracellular septation protein A
MAIDHARVKSFLKTQGPPIAVEVAVNFLAPFFIYDACKTKLGDFNALLVSSAPPILWSVIEFARKRKIDALSMMVVAGIVLSCLAVLGGGSVKFLQLREKLVTVLIGLAFIFSAVIGKPLIYYFSRATLRRRGSAELAQFEALRENVYFRRSMSVMTLVWGFGLVAEAALAAVLVFRLSVHDYLLVAPLVGYSAIGGLALWSFLYVRRQRARGKARLEAQEGLKSAALTPPNLISQPKN